MIAFLLVIIGGLNWGLVGLVDFDLVSWIFTDLIGVEVLTRIVYVVVGLAAVSEVLSHKGNCTHCGTASGGSNMPPGGDVTHG